MGLTVEYVLRSSRFFLLLLTYRYRILSMVPLVSFVVLAGNAIATSSSIDLPLLSNVTSIMGPTAEKSPTARKIHDACKRFERIASLIVSSTNGHHSNQETIQVEAYNGIKTNGPSFDSDMLESPQPLSIDEFNLPMGQQDWDSALMGFQSELGDYDSRSLTNIIEPYFLDTSW